MNDESDNNNKHVTYQRIRTITGFAELLPTDFETSYSAGVLEDKISKVVLQLRRVKQALENAGYTVQTLRLATNPFEEWLLSSLSSDTTPQNDLDEKLQRLDRCLETNDLDFCALGPAETINSIQQVCPRIVAASSRFSCSATLHAGDINTAKAAAGCIRTISTLQGAPHIDNGLGNFRFCVAAANSKPYIPFFPIAKSASSNSTADTGPAIQFAIGLENGTLAQHLLKECGSIQQISTVFRDKMAQALLPIQTICEQCSDTANSDDSSSSMQFVGIDSSLNPSLDEDGSVAAAIECLKEVQCFGGPGTLAAAAAITHALQSLPGITLTGYCGLMLPLCEDTRLAELTSNDDDCDGGASLLRISDLLNISNVCGVGIDTVPVPGNVDQAELASLLLDVAGIAQRWGKSLSCRVFPVPNKNAGESTAFESPYLVNSRILPLSFIPNQVPPTT